MRKSHLLSTALIKSGVVRLADALWGPDRLTILVYHRIIDMHAPNFRYFRPNVSATPEMFGRHMDFVAEHFNVIDLSTLQNFVVNNDPLPPRPLLITFDDGYLDNYSNAFPILRDHGFPAVIFLITNQMDDPTPPWWEQCAYYFECAPRKYAQLPFIGETDLSTSEKRLAARAAFLDRLKHVPEVYKQRAMHELPTVLDVCPPKADSSLFVSWQQVRELVANGVACQPHTLSHPILSQVDYTEMSRQIQESRCRIEAETGQAATCFAYPNGLSGDYPASASRALREAGYTMAFTHETGPIRADDAQHHPFEISRIPIDYRDTFEMFVTKAMGVSAFGRRQRYKLSTRAYNPASTQDRYEVAGGSLAR